MNDNYQLRLYVAGSEPNSQLARKNLQEICERHLSGSYNIEVIDVLVDFESAIRDSVFVTPALILTAPAPQATIFGNLSDTKKVLAALKLEEVEYEPR